jgi:hypothetical protein
MNPFALIGIAALAFFAFARKKRPGPSAPVDVTGTVPQQPGPGENTAPPPDPNQAEAEAAAASYAVTARPMSFFLGEPGLAQGVLGIDEDGLVTPQAGEYISGWLTRVAYWGLYGAQGWPLQLPVTCMIAATCPPEYLPARLAVLRLNNRVKETLAALNQPDVRV